MPDEFSPFAVDDTIVEASSLIAKLVLCLEVFGDGRTSLLLTAIELKPIP